MTTSTLARSRSRVEAPHCPATAGEGVGGPCAGGWPSPGGSGRNPATRQVLALQKAFVAEAWGRQDLFYPVCTRWYTPRWGQLRVSPHGSLKRRPLARGVARDGPRSWALPRGHLPVHEGPTTVVTCMHVLRAAGPPPRGRGDPAPPGNPRRFKQGAMAAEPSLVTLARAAVANGPADEKPLPQLPQQQRDAVARVLTARGDPHHILGISDDGVTPATARRAFKRLAVLIHPDKNQMPQASRAFARARAALNEIVARCSRKPAPVISAATAGCPRCGSTFAVAVDTADDEAQVPVPDCTACGGAIAAVSVGDLVCGAQARRAAEAAARRDETRRARARATAADMAAEEARLRGLARRHSS